jgi:hypothetical protein
MRVKISRIVRPLIAASLMLMATNAVFASLMGTEVVGELYYDGSTTNLFSPDTVTIGTGVEFSGPIPGGAIRVDLGEGVNPGEDEISLITVGFGDFTVIEDFVMTVSGFDWIKTSGSVSDVTLDTDMIPSAIEVNFTPSSITLTNPVPFMMPGDFFALQVLWNDYDISFVADDSTASTDFSAPVSTPEPSTLILFGIGILGVLWVRYGRPRPSWLFVTVFCRSDLHPK